MLLFAPLAYEPDILKLRRTLSTKAQLFLPFMLDKSLKIVKLRLPLKKDRFNVRQAMDSNAYIPHLDLALIPVIVNADVRLAQGSGGHAQLGPLLLAELAGGQLLQLHKAFVGKNQMKEAFT